MAVLRWGGVFFATTNNPLPEPVEGGLFAKRCRHFDRLSDRVAADEFVCKEASALESPLDATLGGHEPTRDWRGGRKPVAPGNGVGRAPRNPGKPVTQRGGGRNLAKEWMVERLYAPSKI